MKFNIKNISLDKSPEEFKDKIQKENLFLETYEDHFFSLSSSHPQYRFNWRVSFLDSHRFMNWVVYDFLKAHKDFNPTVLDVGSYDSCLVKCLNENGIECYGYEEIVWDEFYKILGTEDFIRKGNEKDFNNCDVAVFLNYAHTIKVEDFLNVVEDKCKSMPSLIIFDHDASISNMYSDGYYDWASKGEFELLKFKNYKERDLFIWEKK